MKKLFTVFWAAILFIGLCANANAFQIQNFTLDFSVLDNNFGTYNNINNINYDSIEEPNTWIYQDLGADGILGNGDTFTETGFMNLSTLSPGGAPFLYDNDGSLGYGIAHQFSVNLYFSGLTGSIYNYSDNGTPLNNADDTWDYSFDTGSGTVGWYLDDNTNPMDGIIQSLLTGHVIQPSNGTADGFLSDVGASSNWDVTAEIDTVDVTGFLLDEDGNELWDTMGQFDWLQTITTGDTTVQNQQFIPGTENDSDQILFIGATGDQTVLNAVPEPSTFLLLGGGLIGLGLIARKRKQQ